MEVKLKEAIPLLDKVNDKISSKVREQYEENPYPRWVNLATHMNSSSITKLSSDLKLKFVENKVTRSKTPEILIAGCGTGLHAIDTATRFKGCKVLAIDLSLSSLAYVKRKTLDLKKI